MSCEFAMPHRFPGAKKNVQAVLARKEDNTQTSAHHPWRKGNSVRNRRLFAVLAALAMALGLQVSGSGSANAAAPSCVSRGSEIQPGSVMNPGECIRSGDNRFRLIMQKDGNLVLYVTSTGRACWASSWDRRGYYQAGDKMFFNTLTIGYYTESSIIVDTTRGDMFPTYNITYSDTRPPGVGRSYTASINNSGQFWIGWDLHRSC
jgi:hypothetical protein